LTKAASLENIVSIQTIESWEISSLPFDRPSFLFA